MLQRAAWSLAYRLDASVGLPTRRDTAGADAVLTYHSVGDTGGDAVAPATFRRHLELLTDRYEVVDLPAIVGTDASHRRVAVTFDDGFADFADAALPAIEAFDVPVTLFLSAGLLDGRRPRLAARRHDVDDADGPRMLADDQVATLVDHPLVTIGNHTLTHANLRRVDDLETLRREVLGNRARLEDRFGASIDRFSYPYHAFSERAHEVVREAHDLAACGVGLVDGEVDPHRVRRISAARTAHDLEWAMSPVPEALRDLHRWAFR